MTTSKMSCSLQISIIIILFICTFTWKSTDSKEFDKSEILNIPFGTVKLDELNFQANLTISTKLINASSNAIREIAKDDFQKGPNLEVFDMNNNTDYKFPAKVPFLVHSNLQIISLDSCNIMELYNETFSQLPKLTSLSMNRNKIKALNFSVFRSNPILKFLYLNSNEISTIAPQLLQNHIQFEELQMNFNPTFTFEDNKEFLVNRNLVSFKCEYCNVTRIYQNTFAQLPNLRILILNNNNINHIEGKSFQNNNAIEVLELNNNSLPTIPIVIFGKPNLKILHIDLNKFEPSIENDEIKMYYAKKPYRSPNSSIPVIDYFETRLKTFATPTESTSSKPTPTTRPTDDCASQESPLLPDGISDAFISSYLTLIVLVEIVVLGLTITCWIKKSREESSEYIDYSKTVLNEHDIYKMN